MREWNPTPPGWRKQVPTTLRTRGEVLWRVTFRQRVLSCELYNESAIGAGWDVAIREYGELSFSRRCPTEAFARYVANALKQVHVNAGWMEELV